MNSNINNPFNIPDLRSMYNAVRDYVKEHQGEKGFINTDDPHCDTMYTIAYDCGYKDVSEYEIKAVRVDSHNKLQILYDSFFVYYTDESIAEMEKEWRDVEYDDYVCYIPTIFNIAEGIREYVEY